MTVLNLIVARGGSKRIPGKNLQKIGSHSLVGYKCLAAPEAIISSDDMNILREAMSGYSLDRIIIRSPELATDTATTEDVVRDVMERTEPTDAIMLLEPSSPFVSP